MRYRLSQLIPVPMRSRYGWSIDGGDSHLTESKWWQFRGRIWRHWQRAI